MKNLPIEILFQICEKLSDTDIRNLILSDDSYSDCQYVIDERFRKRKEKVDKIFPEIKKFFFDFYERNHDIMMNIFNFNELLHIIPNEVLSGNKNNPNEYHDIGFLLTKNHATEFGYNLVKLQIDEILEFPLNGNDLMEYLYNYLLNFDNILVEYVTQNDMYGDATVFDIDENQNYDVDFYDSSPTVYTQGDDGFYSSIKL